MGRTLKTILWTIVVFAVIFLIAKVFFIMLPVLLVAFAGIYIYGKLKKNVSGNKSQAKSYNEGYVKEAAYTSDEDVVAEVVDVDFEDVK